MAILYFIIVAGYLVCTLVILFYCSCQIELFYHAITNRKKIPQHLLATDNLPNITVQLPVYNEKFVVARLIDCICKFEYPPHLLQIQVLDDSTDETLSISQQKVAAYQSLGVDIQLLHRKKRNGFKAGALQDAMPFAKGEYIAIFDADFMPEADFLLKTISYFTHPDIAIVQTKWLHLNQYASLLTRLQALQLNVHFLVEQVGRFRGKYFLQFNGTAGVWRKSAIESAGGWQADTLTEDLDLSYRTQLKNQKIIYTEHIGVPAELPSNMLALKIQQFRWMKGGAACAKKLLYAAVTSPQPLSLRLQALQHLCSSSIFIIIFILSILSIGMPAALQFYSLPTFIFSISMVSFFMLIIVYIVANADQKWWQVIAQFFLFLAFSTGLSLHNSKAVLEGWQGKQSEFIRTPKTASADKLHGNKQNYKSQLFLNITILEFVMCVVFAISAGTGFQMGSYFLASYHLLVSIGFCGVGAFTLSAIYNQNEH